MSYYDIERIELEHWAACFEEAANNGHSQEDAEMCEAGELDCINCPFERCNNCSLTGAQPSTGLCEDCTERLQQ